MDAKGETVTTARIATFNSKNFDETRAGERPLSRSASLMKPQVVRLRADIACFQEVNGQERPNQPRALLALQQLLDGTNLKGATLVNRKPQDDDVYNERNLVVATHHQVVSQQQ